MPEIATLIPAGDIELAADISIPDRASSVVVFAHGSGSSRHSPRNLQVAGALHRGGIGSILVDLLTEEEEAIDIETAELRFDIPRLGRRLGAITGWILTQPAFKKMKLGYFGASTGAAAAFVAAADRPRAVRAVVSRGGRPDLAGAALQRVEAPTLFIVGGNDPVVLDLNYWALARLPHQTAHKLEIIPGAGHLFEEPGALDKVAALARDWFRAHLGSASTRLNSR
ncbi:MAG TPA: dienelactone hydrolase family protein [Bryobacteraceae bacterium]|nr:dienelactone hydrolase family protein [Bryobacteraceae bacterium]